MQVQAILFCHPDLDYQRRWIEACVSGWMEQVFMFFLVNWKVLQSKIFGACVVFAVGKVEHKLCFAPV